MHTERKESANGEPVRAYFMPDDMRKYTLNLGTFCGDEEKVATLAMKIEMMVEAEGLTCEEAMMLPAYLYMRMEMTEKEQLNRRKFKSLFTNET